MLRQAQNSLCALARSRPDVAMLGKDPLYLRMTTIEQLRNLVQ